MFAHLKLRGRAIEANALDNEPDDEGAGLRARVRGTPPRLRSRSGECTKGRLLTIGAGLIIARFVHFLALSVLLGGALFPFYGLARSDAQRLHWLQVLLIGAAVLSWASGLVWFALMFPDPEFLWIWLFRLMLATVLVLVVLGKHATGRRLQAIAFCSLHSAWQHRLDRKRWKQCGRYRVSASPRRRGSSCGVGRVDRRAGGFLPADDDVGAGRSGGVSPIRSRCAGAVFWRGHARGCEPDAQRDG